ncbi:N-acetylmannosamine-6-phosphate 2-epimerase [Escherichia coli]|uniref:N-acylglucosamine-6-phosphate 2-epimerase n=1 Tax=Escherichia coli TaxID=562 RepID=A0A376VCR7_ECOLX|nr:N-acetylmannosamine-6-phosphate 2-epimerase [Escherichia coli]
MHNWIKKIAANGGLIVSCQPVPDSPLDKPEIVAAMALAAEQAGAVAIRIEGVANLQATRAVVSVPIIGIVKRDLEDSPVRITAYIEDVDALAQAGADIIAIDGTDRPRPVPVETLLARIHHHGFTGDDRLLNAGRRPGMPKAGSRNYWHYAFWLYHA